MKTKFWLALGVGALFSLSAAAQEVTLTRLDCGSGSNDPRRFTDTFAYTELTKPFTFSCYVIRHGANVMVWDTGYLPGSVPSAINKPLADLLKQINEPPRLSWRPIGVSQTGVRSAEFGCLDFLSCSPPQGPPEAPRLGHVFMVQPLLPLSCIGRRKRRSAVFAAASSLPRLRPVGCSRWVRAADGC